MCFKMKTVKLLAFHIFWILSWLFSFNSGRIKAITLEMYPEIVRFGVAGKPKTIVEGEEKAAVDNVVDMPKAAGI